MRSCSSDLEKSDVERYWCVVCGVWWCVTPKIFEEFCRTLKNSVEEDAVSGVLVCVCGVSHYRTLKNSEEEDAVSGVSVCVCVVYRTTLPLHIFYFLLIKFYT